MALPQHRRVRQFLPSQSQAMVLLSKCLHPFHRDGFEIDFMKVMEGGKVEGEVAIEHVLKSTGCSNPEQLVTMSNMFPSSGAESSHGTEIYIMDVILNQADVQTTADDPAGGAEPLTAVDPDCVVMVRSFAA